MSDNDSEIAWTITALRILLDIHPASEDGALVKGAEDLTAERDRLKGELETANRRTFEKMTIANEFIAKFSHRFRAFEEFEEAAEDEDGNAWDAAFADLKAECERFGILVAHPDKHHADSLAAMTKRAVTAEEETWDLHECDEGKACHICRNVYARREGAEG